MSYPAAMMQRAREHRASEWRPREIADLLEREFGRRPAENTVRGWVDAKYQAGSYAASNAAARRRRAKQSRGRLILSAQKRLTPEFKLARMQALNDIGLPPGQIAKVMELDFGQPLSRYFVVKTLNEARA